MAERIGRRLHRRRSSSAARLRVPEGALDRLIHGYNDVEEIEAHLVASLHVEIGAQRRRTQQPRRRVSVAETKRAETSQKREKEGEEELGSG